jgi:integrase/recombinase XerD
MLRHTFVTTMLNAGLDLRTSRSPLATMRYDRARQNPDRHPNYVLAASGT